MMRREKQTEFVNKLRGETHDEICLEQRSTPGKAFHEGREVNKGRRYSFEDFEVGVTRQERVRG